MRDDLNITDEGDYLYFKFSGKFSVNSGVKVIDAMMEASTQHRCFAAL